MDREPAAFQTGTESRHETRVRPLSGGEGRGVATEPAELDRRRLDHEERMIALAETVTAAFIAAREEARDAVLDRLSQSEERLAAIADGLAHTLETAGRVEATVGGLKAEIEVSDALAAEYMAENAELRAHVGHLEYNIAALRGEYDALSTRQLFQMQVAPDSLSQVYAELASLRETRMHRLLGTFRRDVLWDDVAPAFDELKAYSGAKIRRSGYRLALSADIGSLDYREYAMPMTLDRLSRVGVAVNPLAPSGGEIGIEVVSADHVVLAQVARPLASVSTSEPTIFELALERLARDWRLRVFARDATAPVTVYELVNPSVLRRRPRRLPFVSLA